MTLSKKSKSILVAIISSAVIVVGLFVGIGSIRKWRFARRQQTIDNRERLIELSVSRENFFWGCFRKKIDEETQKWQQSPEYSAQKRIYDDWYNKCRQNSQNFCFGGSKLFPQRPWQLHNEIASKFCSESADNTQEGLLIKKFRNLVPSEALTDYELQKIVQEYVSQ